MSGAGRELGAEHGGGRACELCVAAPVTPWHAEDDTCWVAECESCGVPMVVWRLHGTDPPPGALDHMLSTLARVADEQIGPGGWVLDRVRRQIPEHFHAHARRRWPLSQPPGSLGS